MSVISRVALVGGTHGDEFTGAYLVKKWSKQPQLIERDGISVVPILANPRAFGESRRFIDKDLNRQFRMADLERGGDSYEEKRAGELNKTIGLASSEPCDFILDLHTTTANMGRSIFLSTDDRLVTMLAVKLAGRFRDIKIVQCPDNEWGDQSPVLCDVARRGFLLEVGPVAKAVLNANIFRETEEVVYALLDALVETRAQDLKSELANQEVVMYRMCDNVDFPRDTNGEIAGMVHPDRLGGDYRPVRRNDPLFMMFDGGVVCYDGDSERYPIFINESAYLGEAAMIMTEKVLCKI